MSMDSVEWLPWGQVRVTPRGVETAFHHPLIAIRVRDEPQIRVINPGDVLRSYSEPAIEGWCPMPWAKAGRREWKDVGGLGHYTAFYGQDGHLFHTINVVCEQLFEAHPLGNHSINLWCDLIRRRFMWCWKKNISYRHIVIPEHHSIYADMIPGRPSLSSQRPLLRILNALEPPVREALVYPLDSMIKGREKFDTSMRHDVHFTGFGCFLCYRDLISSMGFVDSSEIIAENDLVSREVFVAGDVAHAAGAPGMRVKFHQPPKVPFRTLVKGTSFKTNQVDVFVSEAPSGRSLVLFRTSNSTQLIPYLLHHFSRITAVATTRVFYDLLESEQPDFVVAEMPERYLAPHARPPGSELKTFDDASFVAETGVPLPLPKE